MPQKHPNQYSDGLARSPNTNAINWSSAPPKGHEETTMPTTLPRTSYDWALKHLLLEGDTDLLPPLPELDAIRFSWPQLAPLFVDLDVEQYRWKGERRFIVPKENLAFRSATQLDPLDSLIFAAIVRKWGGRIERIRIPVDENRVYSHRFAPTTDGRFYGEASGWHEFWARSIDLAHSCQAVLMADITDYYNQIYHHVLENQLQASGLPSGIWKSIKRLISHLTQSVSRGVPVGPHPVHLLAEVALNPIDRSMVAHGFEFCRFVDDIHVFCASEQAAVTVAQDLATIIDNQQRLTLQKQKTKIMSANQFINYAQMMLKDRPIDDIESDILQVIQTYSGDSPYDSIDIQKISTAHLDVLRAERLEPLLSKYLTAEHVEYGHVRWLLRRLSQLGAPGAIDFVLQHLNELAPALGDVARYIMRAARNYTGNWISAGQRIVGVLEHPLVERSEYVRVILLHLFARVPALDHVSKLTARYQSEGAPVRREILFAARAAGDGAWLRERKADLETADPWLRRAIVASASAWPGDESEHWIKHVKSGLSLIEKLLLRWAFRDKHLNVGTIEIA